MCIGRDSWGVIEGGIRRAGRFYIVRWTAIGTTVMVVMVASVVVMVVVGLEANVKQKRLGPGERRRVGRTVGSFLET